MMLRSLRVSVICLLFPAAAFAQQVLETTGSRALGMGGAFVAVADDPTAVYWNPAGLASGPPAGITIGWADFRTGDQLGAPVAGATQRTSKFVSLGTLPVGLSYGHFQESALTPSLGTLPRAQSVSVSQYGVTLLQTVTQGFVIASTFKYVRGSVTSGPVEGQSTGDALKAAADREGAATGHLDADIGAMADLRRARIGLLVRNVREPSFGDAAQGAVKLQRQTRLGLAILPGSGLTLAMDLDLDTVDLRDGPRRILAFGGEQRLGRLAVRAGTRWNLAGPRRMVGALGGSALIRKGVWIDAHYTEGRLDADRGFGIALRMGS
jgi:F plasmid transfer operon protein TraF